SSHATGPTSPSTTTCAASDETPSASTSWQEDSPVSTSRRQPTAPHAETDGCGPTSHESFVKSSRAGSSSRMSTPFATRIADSPRFSSILPRWGSMRNGVLCELHGSAPHITEPEYGWLPTPTFKANQLCRSMMKWRGCRNLFQLFPAGELCLIYEWLMGFPIGYSDVSDLGMPSSQSPPNGSDVASSPRKED